MRTKTGCEMKQAIPPVVMADLGSHRICGAKNGKNFLETVRGSSEGGCQKEGYVPCNPDSQPQNMVCVLSNELSSCPITDLALFDT